MDFPIHIDTISIGLSILHFKKPQVQSKKEGKDQESIQSSTTPDPGYQWESDNFTIRYHKREPRGQPFPNRSQMIYFSKQTVQTQMKCSIMLHFIWVFTVCQSTHLEVSSITLPNHTQGHINPLYSDGFSHNIDTICIGLSILHFEEPQVELSK